MTKASPTANKRAFLVGLLTLNLVYLAAEAIFNSSLLDLVVQQSISPEDLEAIELVGRSIAGAGAALLMLGLLAPRGIRASIVVPVVLSTALLVYSGQKWLIDYYVDQTNAEERADAQRMLYLKQGLIAGYVQIKELPNHLMEPGEPLIPASRTFLALMGWLAPTSPGFQTLAQSRLDDILERVLGEESSEQSEATFKVFQAKARTIDALYDRYREADREYALAKAGDPQASVDAWVEVNEGVADGYDTWMSERNVFNQKIATQAARVQPTLAKFTDSLRKECGTRDIRCLDRYNEHYAKRFTSVFGASSTWKDWCVSAYDLRDYDMKSTVLDPLIDGAGHLLGAGGSDWDCSRSKNNLAIEAKIREQNQHEFESKSGYPYNTSRADYLTASLTSQRVARDLRRDGLDLPAGWTLDDRTGFIEAYQREIQVNADPRWNRKTRDMVGQPLPHDLSQDAFFSHDAVQAKMANVLGDLYREGIRPDMNEGEFRGAVTYPGLQENAASIVELLTEDIDRFDDGGDKADEGKKAVRTLLIPNIALLISAIVVVLTLVKTFWLLLSLLPVDSIGRHIPMLIRVAGKIGISLAVIVAIPVSLSNPFTKSEGFTFFMEEAREASLPVWASSYYLMRLQPELAPIGTQLREWMEAADPTREAAAEQDEQTPLAEPEAATAEVDNLLRQAETAFNKDYLLTPRDRSAIHYFEQTLAIDPGNEQALAGLERVAERYRYLAQNREAPTAATYRERSETVEEIIRKAQQSKPPAKEPADTPHEKGLPMLPRSNNPLVTLMWLIAIPLALWLMFFWPRSARNSSRRGTG